MPPGQAVGHPVLPGGIDCWELRVGGRGLHDRCHVVNLDLTVTGRQVWIDDSGGVSQRCGRVISRPPTIAAFSPQLHPAPAATVCLGGQESSAGVTNRSAGVIRGLGDVRVSDELRP